MQLFGYKNGNIKIKKIYRLKITTMKTFTELKEINEMKYGQSLYSAMKACFDKLSKEYGYTGSVGQTEPADL